MVTSWSIMVTRVQMEWIKLQGLIFEQTVSTKDSSNIYILTQSSIELPSTIAIRCLFHVFNAKAHVQMRPKPHYTPVFRYFAYHTS